MSAADQSAAPAPLVPADCDLRDFAFMPLDVRRLLTSETWVLGTAEEKVAALTLWAESWHQVPAASLPDNDRMLAHLSQAGARWAKIKEHVLRGWVRCADGRLYHPVVAEKAREAFAKKEKQRERSRKANSARWGGRGEQGDRSDAASSRGGSRQDAAAQSQGHLRDEHDASRKDASAIPQGSDDDPIRMPQGVRRGLHDGSSNDPKGQGQGESSLRSESLFLDPDVRTGDEPPDRPSRRARKSTAGGEPEGFAEWYDAFPRHVGRAEAAKAYGRVIASGRAEPASLLAATRLYAAERASQDPHFTKHPASWLNAGRWADERGGTPTKSPPQAVIALDEWRDRMSYFRETGSWGWWSDSFPPNEEGCTVPAEILAEFDLAPVQSRRVAGA